MVLQLAFQLNFLSLKLILTNSLDFVAQGASASKLPLTIPKFKFLMETRVLKSKIIVFYGNFCWCTQMIDP